MKFIWIQEILGVGKGVSVQEVIDSSQKVNNLEISYELGPRRTRS